VVGVSSPPPPLPDDAWRVRRRVSRPAASWMARKSSGVSAFNTSLDTVTSPMRWRRCFEDEKASTDDDAADDESDTGTVTEGHDADASSSSSFASLSFLLSSLVLSRRE